MMYIYNNCKYPLSDNSVKTLGKSEESEGGTTTIKEPFIFLPHQWVSTGNVDMAAFETSLYNGKIKAFVEKGYLRVLTAEEYRQEFQKVQREKDLAIPSENEIPQGLGIYNKAIRDNRETSTKYSSLIEEDDMKVGEVIEDSDDTFKESLDEDRFNKIEQSISSLSLVVTSLLKEIKSPKKTKKVVKKPIKKSVKSKKTSKKKSKK